MGKVLVQEKLDSIQRHFAPARYRDAAHPPHPHPVEAAQLGVGIEGGLEELVHAVSVALQSHPCSNPDLPAGWVCISVDFRNFFNCISRPAAFRALLANPNLSDLFPFLSMIYSKVSPAKLWADLGGEGDWDDILSREGVHQGCTFGSLLASLALHPILEEVAASMGVGMVGAYIDDVKLLLLLPLLLMLTVCSPAWRMSS